MPLYLTLFYGIFATAQGTIVLWSWSLPRAPPAARQLDSTIEPRPRVILDTCMQNLMTLRENTRVFAHAETQIM
jgi:hypothetical protein